MPISRLQNNEAAVSDEMVTYTYATLVGLLSAAYLSVRYWQSAELDLFRPVFFAGVLTGLLCWKTTIEPRRAGLIIGLVGSISSLWIAAEMVAFVSGLDHSVWSDGVQLVSVAVAMGVIATLAALSGLIGTVIGTWMRRTAAR